MKRLFALLLVTVSLVAAGSAVTAAPASASTPCWTSFNPSNPQGGSMVQTYRNCNGYGVSVMPYYQNATPSYYVFDESCTFVANNAVVTWRFSGTVPHTNYGTAFCDPDEPPTSWSHSSGPKNSRYCWTYVSAGAPFSAIVQYEDCSASPKVTVAPAYWDGSLHGYSGSCLANSPPAGQVSYFEWDFNFTPPNISYEQFTTVFCVGAVH